MFNRIGVPLAIAFALLQGPISAQEAHRVYIGTYTGAKSKGIYLLELNTADGSLVNKGLAAEVASPSFLAVHPSQKLLYSVNEVETTGGKKAGGVTAFSIDAKTGMLTRLNDQLSGGGGPCHLVVDKAGKNVLVANYGGGSSGVLPIYPDGKLGEMSGFQQHTGSSVKPDRQKEPHAHSINLDPANKFAFVADLGLDKVLVFRFDGAKGTINENDPPAAKVAPGAGPRHFAFHPTGKYAYVINELDSTVTAFSYDATVGVLKEIQTITSLPKDFTGTNYPADVQVHASGKFVYGSNRGHNSIAVFAVDQATGKLTAVQHQAEGIKNPRNFGIDPSGQWMLVGNQDTDNVCVFRIDQKSGELKVTGIKVDVPSPVCIKFVPSVPK